VPGGTEEHRPCWACRQCIVYAQDMSYRLKEIQKRLENVYENGKKIEGDIARIE
jgi:hypothetical protein